MQVKPIFIALIASCAIILFIWFVALIFQSARRKPLFTENILHPSHPLNQNQPLGKEVQFPDLPIFNHTYSNNLGNIDPKKFTCNVFLFNDFVGTNTLTIELKLPTQVTSGLSGLTIFQCVKIEYTKTGNEYIIGTDKPSCVDSFGPYTSIRLHSINYVPSTTQEPTFLVVFNGFTGDNPVRTYILKAVQGSNTMAFVTKALTDYLASSGILTTPIGLPSFSEADINNETYKNYTHTVGVLPGAACLTCSVTDSTFDLNSITSISLQDIEITDIILLNEDVPGSNIFNCSAIGSLNPLSDGSGITVNTNGFGIDLKCHCGFDAGPLDIINPFKEYDKTAKDEWKCANSTAKLHFKGGNLVSLNFKIDLGSLLVVSFDSVVFRENPVMNVNNILQNCDAMTSLLIDGTNSYASLKHTDNFINKLLLSSANDLLKETIPNLLRDLLNQNVSNINAIIEKEKGKVL
jgi:hypothetical protein